MEHLEVPPFLPLYLSNHGQKNIFWFQGKN
jgi:hypothetical protein